MYFYLNEHEDKKDILNAMSILYYSGGSTNTATALQTMRNDMFNSGRGLYTSSLAGRPKFHQDNSEYFYHLTKNNSYLSL